MCGRFTLRITPEVFANWYQVAEPPEIVPRYNIAPTQPVLIVRSDSSGSQRDWSFAHWGLIPSWLKDPGSGARMINARAETVMEKPSFRAAFRRRRCLVPVDGFYEWKQIGKGKQPYLISMADGSPFAFAGLWEYWQGSDGSEIESCTILTTEPNELMASLHNRMPVILAREDYTEWLTPTAESEPKAAGRLLHLLRPFPDEQLHAYAVSRYVNSPANEGAVCVEPVEQGK
jgi:putative SOS response-associated peptidase YedK